MQEAISKNSKKRNLASANFSDFDEAYQQRIREQVEQANCETTDAVSGASSVTSPSVQPKKQDPRGTRGTGYIFIVDVQVLVMIQLGYILMRGKTTHPLTRAGG